jgi:hypothetical protein
VLKARTDFTYRKHCAPSQSIGASATRAGHLVLLTHGNDDKWNAVLMPANIAALPDPLTGGEAGELRTVQTAASAVVEVSDQGAALLRLTGSTQPSHAAALPVDHLALEQQGNALLEGELLGGRVRHLLKAGRRTAGYADEPTPAWADLRTGFHRLTTRDEEDGGRGGN